VKGIHLNHLKGVGASAAALSKTAFSSFTGMSYRQLCKRCHALNAAA
jgi:hypothetical protein